MRYQEYVRVQELLQLQNGVLEEGNVDEATFLIAHQLSELTLKLIHAELDRLVEIEEGASGVLRRIDKVNLLLEMLESHLVLCGFVPRDVFFAIRKRVFPATAQESKQFEELFRRMTCVEEGAEKNLCRVLRVVLERIEEGEDRDSLRRSIRKLKETVERWRQEHRELALHYLGGQPGAMSEGVTYLEERRSEALLPGWD